MKVHYEIEKKVIFAPEACALWPIEDPLARATLYAPASQCFLLLLQSAGDILSQKFLFAEVWGKNGLYVNANTLYQNIAVLRKTLKSMGIKEEIIKTVPRQGLKFTGQSTLVQYEEQSKGPTVQQAQINVQETAPDENEMPAQAVNGKEAIEIDAYRFTAWLKKRIWLIPAAIIACSLFLVL